MFGKPKNVLLVYKLSAYEIYFFKPLSSFLSKSEHFEPRDIKPFKLAHQQHYKTLGRVEQVLKELGIKFRSHARSRQVDCREFDFVISVGGDGTFLETARGVKKQVILGVNSDPERSVGRFCAAHADNFKRVLENYFRGRARVRSLRRLRLSLAEQNVDLNVANDILVCHNNPAAMSRYSLSLGALAEMHYSSGIWISTAAGSSGAIKSAGGRVLPIESDKVQFLTRELYEKKGRKYRLKRGIVDRNKPMKIKSLMRNGMIYVDGSHLRLKFHFGETARISSNGDLLNVIHS